MTKPEEETICERGDWAAALFTTLLAGSVFFYYMAPEVTLQDSGELVTGAFTLGVPHPPGYPLWAFLGFVWSHFVVPFGNPAWRIGTMSVVTGALTVGVLTLLMARSTRVLMKALPAGERIDAATQRWIALTAGASTALLFAFNRGVWLWAGVSEMRVLNVFSFVWIAYLFFRWTLEPERRKFLYWTIFLFGLSMANHQTIAVMAVPIGVGAIAVGVDLFLRAQGADGLSPTLVKRVTTVPAMVDDPRSENAGSPRQGRRGPPRGCREEHAGRLIACLSAAWELTAAALLCGMVLLLLFAWLKEPNSDGVSPATLGRLGVAIGTAGVVLLVAGRLSGCWSMRRALAVAGCFLAGVSFYAYMPLAASTNPPMNWGYAATKAGFLHAVTRAQYEKLKAAPVMTDEFLLKVKVFLVALVNQYSLWLTLLGAASLAAVAYAAWRWRHARPWIVFVLTAFLATSLGLLTIINPRLDRQEQEITIKFFAPAHGFFAIFIGYGIAALLGFLAWRGRRGSAAAVRWLGIALLALPAITFGRNQSLCALRGHDFGYLFGYLMFEPGGGYPAMEQGAILYGGTDPGRFVPTYMIFCESKVAPRHKFRDKSFDRSDVYIITQNALADATYMNYIRDHYADSRPANEGPAQRLLGRDRTFPSEPIHIPGTSDVAAAFNRYLREVGMGIRPRNADIKVENGKVSIVGAQGVMEVNSILAQWIFEQNRDRRAFYVEESYVIPWMYPYLCPSGVIMRLEKAPLPTPHQNPARWRDIVSRDRAYWDRLSAEFLGRADFRRNNDARKSFSKLRTAIAGVYAFRQMGAEAEYAFRQALQLYPESPEASFRLAELYMKQRRYAEARKLMEDYQQVDTYNAAPRSFLNAIQSAEKDDARRRELETRCSGGRVDLNSALELAAVYQRLRMDGEFDSIVRTVLGATHLPSSAYMAVAQLCGNSGRWPERAAALRRGLEQDRANVRGWVELAFCEVVLDRHDDAVASLRQAIARGGSFAREFIRNDERFAPLGNRPDFRGLFGSDKPTGTVLQTLGLLQR